MLTKEEIIKWAISAFSSDAAIVRAISGATWANEQNAAEIARLKKENLAYAKQFVEGGFALNKCFETRADLKAENERLKAEIKILETREKKLESAYSDLDAEYCDLKEKTERDSE